LWNSWLAWKWIATEKLRDAYAKIKQGDSETQVLKTLGTPLKKSGPPENISWDSDNSLRPNKGECVQEFWYVPPISIAGEEFTIGFDAHSNVVSKYRYESP
jgi:outer membrane protein assembly factor BamE (lipoprotein component of BamABCDE complex)